MEKTVICRNCGASFPLESPKCPYCSAINEFGAEKEYLNKLDDLKEDLDDLSEVPAQLYKKEAAGILKKILIAVLAVCILCAIVLGVRAVWQAHRHEHAVADQKAQLLWQKDAFPQFDAWYEEGDFDAIAQASYEAWEEGYSIASWEHYYLLSVYEGYQLFMERTEDFSNPEAMTQSTAEYLVGHAMRILFFLEPALYTDEEWTQIEEWRANVEEIFYGEMKFTKEEAEQLYEQINDNGLLDYDKCDKYTDQIWKRFTEQ